MTELAVDADVFSGGPPQRLERTLGLMSPGDPHVVRRAVVAVLATWVPLAVLAGGQAVAGSREAAYSFFTDFATYGRFLLAVPALILAEPDCLPWLRRIVRAFVDEGFVQGHDLARFEAARASARRLLDSRLAETLTIVIAYAIVIALIISIPAAELPAWARSSDARFALSLAGWWNALVSLPILLVLFLGWLWRVVLWGRFLAYVAALDLRLVPAHPDRSAGLRFVSTSLEGFRLVSMAMGALLAGPIVNQVVHHGAAPSSFRRMIVSLLIASAILFAGPLTVFVRHLREARRHGLFTYGALANTVGIAFEARWLRPGAGGDRALSAQDFSATTDLYAIVANVQHMRSLPFRPVDLAGPVGGAAVPFIPVALLAIPLREIADTVIKLML